jgi:4,5:9,10-diseco-3-hydroxy-5,9,17-trioxoandrosta-1(10),2-diene-4-oate hydrolase
MRPNHARAAATAALPAEALPARRLLGATPPWHEVPIDGVRLTYDDEGHGAAIVCWHAIGHGAADFARLRQHLRSRFRVLVLAWPGHGNSGDDHASASATRYAELLDGLLAATGAAPAILVGNSIGGTVAVRFAAAHPERVRALVLANPGRLDRTEFLTPIVTRLMARFFAAGARGAWWYPRAFAAYYRMILTTPAAAEHRTRIVAAGRDVAPVLAQAWRSFGMPDAAVAPLAPTVTCPVLFTWAKRNRINQLSRARPAIARFPNARWSCSTPGTARFSKRRWSSSKHSIASSRPCSALAARIATGRDQLRPSARTGRYR